MTIYFKTADGLRLAYDDTCSGTPLLCLAGLTRNRSDFDFVRRDFRDRARIIRLDSRGRGESDFDDDWRNYSVVQEALDALSLLDHLGIAKTAILGTSRGGLIAMTLAPQHRDRLLGVCLNDIGPALDPAGLSTIMDYLGLPPAYRDYDTAAEGLEAANAARFPGVPRDRWRMHAERIWRQTPQGLSLRYDPRLRESVMAAMPPGEPVPEIWELFDTLHGLPLALIRGKNSDLLTAATAAEMQRRRPDMIHAEVPDRGHVPFLDEPEATAAIAAFLDRLS